MMVFLKRKTPQSQRPKGRGPCGVDEAGRRVSVARKVDASRTRLMDEVYARRATQTMRNVVFSYRLSMALISTGKKKTRR